VETQFESGEKVSLLEFLSENTIVWLKDWDVIKEKIDQQEEDMQGFVGILDSGFRMQNSDDEDDTKILKEVNKNDFVNSGTIEQQLLPRHIVEFGYKPHHATNHTTQILKSIFKHAFSRLSTGNSIC
jgi:transcription-repair coupling factor (superfamily II helicase)